MARAVVITGASSGIGRAAALRLHAGGWRVFAGVRKDSDAQAAAAAGLSPVRLDVTDPASIAAAAITVADEAGGTLHGLVNNAGIAVGGPLEFVPLERFREQIEVNLTGQLAVAQAFLEQLRTAPGRIVNVTSIGGRLAFPGFGPYHASKFGLEAVSDCLRRELRPWGIGVSVVEPGSIDTQIWGKGIPAAESMLAALPARAHELYDASAEEWLGAARELARQAIPAEPVAKAIEHALSARRPRTRYVVGRDAKVQAVAARLLPDRLLDRLVAFGVGRAG